MFFKPKQQVTMKTVSVTPMMSALAKGNEAAQFIVPPVVEETEQLKELRSKSLLWGLIGKGEAMLGLTPNPVYLGPDETINKGKIVEKRFSLLVKRGGVMVVIDKAKMICPKRVPAVIKTPAGEQQVMMDVLIVFRTLTKEEIGILNKECLEQGIKWYGEGHWLFYTQGELDPSYPFYDEVMEHLMSKFHVARKKTLSPELEDHYRKQVENSMVEIQGTIAFKSPMETMEEELVEQKVAALVQKFND